jgi:tRNA (cmo5U34)-methyltransferase
MLYRASMKPDKVFAQSRPKGEQFQFNQEVVDVFDDMLKRSIPYYQNNLVLQLELATRYHQLETQVYDLGCSQGNFCLALAQQKPDISIVAVDSSTPMIEALRQRSTEGSTGNNIECRCQPIQETKIQNASVVALNYTLQFIPPKERAPILGEIYNGLIPQGVLLLSEKMTHKDSSVVDLEWDFYRRFKRQQGYSELEISQKREALEKVLIPEPLETHLQRLQAIGFQTIEIWSKWFNFTSLICWK